MSDIFREVDEEVRQEQIINFVKRYGAYVAAAIVLAIVVFGGIRYYEAQQQKEREAAGDRFAKALSLMMDDKLADAIADFSVLAEQDGDEGYGLLARFRKAEALYQSKEVQAAIKVYDAIAADGSVDKIWRNLAGVYGAMLALEVASNDDVAARLDKLSDKDNVWRLSVLELKGLEQYKSGDHGGARKTFREVFDGAPDGSGFRARSAQMLAILGVPASELSAQ